MNIPYKRKREGRTNYKSRLKLLLSGKPRLVVRRSNKNVWCQLVDYQPDGDIVIASAHSKELIKLGLSGARGNVPAAYLTGYLLAKKAAKKKVKEAVLDIGVYASTKGSRLYACLKGALDGGLSIPHGEGILPAKERLEAAHLKGKADMFKKVKEQIK